MNYAVGLKEASPSSLAIAATLPPAGLEDDSASPDITYIEPTKGWRAINLTELWRYRDLLLIFVQRELKVIYKQTALGAVWIILQPLIAAMIFATVANRIALPSEGLPKLLFVFSGMTVWTYFQQSLQNAGNSLVQNRQLVSKVYFPRMVVPLAHTLRPVIDFSVVFVVLVGLMAAFGYHPIWPRLVFIPGILILMIFTASGVALFFSALAVRYRDCSYVLPYLIQIWMWASPVIYPISIFPSRWRTWLALNPLVAIVESFRWVMFGRTPIAGTVVITGIIGSIVILLIGAFFFRRVEREFADIV